MTIDYLRYLGVGDIIRIKVAHGTPPCAMWFPLEDRPSYSYQIERQGSEYVLRVDRIFDAYNYRMEVREVAAQPFARCSTANPDDAGHYVLARVTLAR